jgi:hypothetical protein
MLKAALVETAAYRHFFRRAGLITLQKAATADR